MKLIGRYRFVIVSAICAVLNLATAILFFNVGLNWWVVGAMVVLFAFNAYCAIFQFNDAQRLDKIGEDDKI